MPRNALSPRTKGHLHFFEQVISACRQANGGSRTLSLILALSHRDRAWVMVGFECGFPASPNDALHPLFAAAQEADLMNDRGEQRPHQEQQTNQCQEKAA